MSVQTATPVTVTVTEERSVPRRRWGIAFLLGFGVLVNYFDRVNP
jgi:MFS transporter, ACS family, D-galactonate transporter